MKLGDFGRYLRKEISRVDLDKYAAILTGSRVREKAAKKDTRAALRVAQTKCDIDRTAARQRAEEIKAEALRRAQATRKAARDACKGRKQHLRAEGRSRVEKAVADRAEARRQRKEVRRAEQNAARKSKSRAKGFERHSESDDEVRGNIDAHLIPLWDSVKRKMKATRYKSRTEAFLEYVEAHPEEVHVPASTDEDYARDFEVHLARTSSRRSRPASRRVSAEVPF